MKLGGFKWRIPPDARDSLALQLDNFGGIKGASVGLAAPKEPTGYTMESFTRRRVILAPGCT